MADNTTQPSTFATGAAATAQPAAGTGSSYPSVGSTPRLVNTLQALVPAVPAVAAPAASVSGFLSSVFNGVFDPFAGSNPTAPVDSPLGLALLAFTRREAATAASATNSAAQSTASLVLGGNPIVLTPTLTINNGIIDGSTNALASSGIPLTYTLVSAPSAGGKVTFSYVYDINYQLGNFSYLPDQSVLGGGTANEQFKILVAQNTAFDQFLGNIPILVSFVSPVLVALHQTPILGDVLAPIIGYSKVATFNSTDVLPSADPVAYTYKMTSFDGTKISVNWFPASGLTSVDKAPTILEAPGLANAGQTDPYLGYEIPGLTPGVFPLRDAGYNVVTFDPRGEFASGGVLQLDNPFYEGRDVSSIVDWVAGLTNSDLNSPNDPKVGMVGGSYGGGIQLTSTATDPRFDAIVPGVAWNSLNNSLYPDGAFKTSYGSLLLLSLITTGARINNQIYLGVLTGDLFGFLAQTAQALLSSSGPASLLNQLKTPTLLIQGTVDVLFTLQQAIDNAQIITGNPWDTQVNMIWYCGGHGVCLTGPTSPNPNIADTIAWLDNYVKDGNATPPASIPVFQYTDQNGIWYKANNLPTAGSPFYAAPVQVVDGASGGLLGIIPIVGGSGPTPQWSLPESLVFASKANNAINVQVDTPAIAGGTGQVVGAPVLSFDYQGIGTGGFVYAQLVDNKTGLVVGNLVTPIPVTLDGQPQHVEVNMENIVYTVDNPATDNLTLQITSSATAYENFWAYGLINISNIDLTLPTPATVTPE